MSDEGRVAPLMWVTRALCAAAIIGALDVGLAIHSVPAFRVASLATLIVLVTSVALLLYPALLLALVGALAERWARGWKLPTAATMVTAVLLAVSGGLALTTLSSFMMGRDVEFHDLVRSLQTSVGVALLAGLVVLSLFVHPLLERAFRAFGAATPRRVAMAIALCAACALVFVSHALLYALHLNRESAVTGVAALAVALLAMRWLLPASRRTGRIGGTAALVSVLVGVSPITTPHGRFMLFNHVPIAGGVATTLRDLADGDGDGAAPIWLGGTDCADDDPTRGPTIREVPADGIDQDCRGGDAPALPAPSEQEPIDGCTVPPKSASVLVITVDALRWDVFLQKFAPAVASFALQSFVFNHAYSPGAHTRNSVTSMLFSQPIADLRSDNVLDPRPVVPTSLAEHFHAAGYYTAAFQVFTLDPEVQAGFEQINAFTFDSMGRHTKGIPRSVQMTGAVLDVLRNEKAWPAFVWAHYPDAHAPYPIPPHKGDESADTVEAAYLRSVAYVDREVGRLLGTLQAEGLLDRCVVAITSDHGEDLGWRGRQGHGANLYEESIHVPLIISVPGCPPRNVEEPATLSALGPTLGAIVGVDVPGPTLTPGGPPVVVETSYDGEHRRAIVSERAKLIVDVRNGGRLLFDLEADAEEQHDVLGSRPALAAELEAAYQAWLDRPGQR